MGVLAVRSGSAITARARLTQPSQMYTPGPATISLTCFRLFPQNEHDTGSSESGTHSPYSDSGTDQPVMPSNVLTSDYPGPVTSSVSGNVVECSCFRILAVNWNAWSADVHGRMPLSMAVVTQLVTRSRDLGARPADYDWRGLPRPGWKPSDTHRSQMAA